MDKITFSNKVDTKVTSVAEINKVTGANLNEIKNVTNLAVDQVLLKTDKGAYNGTSQDLKDAIDSVVFDGALTYQTVSDLPIAPYPSEGTPAKVANDPTNSNNGDWSVSSGAWIQNDTTGVYREVSRNFIHNEPTLNDAILSVDISEGDSINLAERTTGNAGGAMWDVVLSSSVTENTYNIVQCTGVSTLSLVLRNTGTYNSLAFGVHDNADASISLQLLANLGGKAVIEDGVLLIESQVNLTVNNTSWYLSQNTIIRNHVNNTGNVLSIQANGIEIHGGFIDGNNLPVEIGDAYQDGSLVSVIQDSSFLFNNVRFGNVLGNNSILGKQALLNISNQGVVFDIIDCDFFNCYVLDDGGTSQDAKFISFKQNIITTATRGKISGGSMIGVGTLLTTGVTADKDGKCIRGYYEHSVSGDKNFDIEITGIYSTQYDEAFVKMSGMKGMNIHHNTSVGIFVNPWDSVVVQSAYFVRNAMTGQTSGITSINNNNVSGIFKKIIEVHETTKISDNTFSIQSNGAENLNVIYEVDGYGVSITDNIYELQKIDKVFNFQGDVNYLRWSNENLGFTFDGDEGAGLGKRLIYSVGNVNNVRIDSIIVEIEVQNTTIATDLAFFNAQTGTNLKNLKFNDFSVRTNHFFNHLPRTVNSITIDGLFYNNIKTIYDSAITLGAPVSYGNSTNKPTNIRINDFEIELNGLTASSTHAIFDFSQMQNSTFKKIKITDKSPSLYTVGFGIRMRGDALDLSQYADLRDIVFQNIKAGTSRILDITNLSNSRIEDISFINTVNNNGSISGIQMSNCENIIIGNVSANDEDLSSWTNLLKIIDGDNYVIGKVNCRGTKASFGSATNVIDNT